MPTIAKITKKGQVTIPLKVRKKLNSEIIEFAVIEDQVIIRPVKSVAGSLKEYAKRDSLPFKEAREKAWAEVVEEHYGKKDSRR
jgi:AbrB family looped-hinge helix DNA binding protein